MLYFCGPSDGPLCGYGSVNRRGVRVVEGARLESVYTRKGIAGSNPALSASLSK
jgi:hypothetical protein